MWRAIYIAFAIFLLGDPLLSQEYFSGKVTQNTRWIGDVYLDGDVTVPKGVILSIESGSRIFMKPHTDSRKAGKDRERIEIIVNGVLQAKGSGPQSSIIFTSEAVDPQMNDWYGIVIKNLYNKSVIRNVVVEFGYKGITTYGSSPVITNSEIRFNHHSGISCEVRAAPEISQSVIVGNGFAGIYCELASSPKIRESIITQNKRGIIIFSGSQPDLGHYPAGDDQSRGENRIYNNFEYDIYNHSNKDVYAQNNYWNTSNPDDIRQTIFDKLQNTAYGSVVIEPTYLQKQAGELPVPSIAARSQRSSTVGTSPNRRTVPNPSSPSTRGRASQPNRPDTTQSTASPVKTTPDTIVKIVPETVYVYKEPEKEAPEKSVVRFQEPVLEAFLDSGKRQYLHREKPRYPKIYLETGTEGNVLIEVIVDKEGKVDDYKVLRSDGELFAEVSIEALKKFRYKPGTINGKPVKFKIVERFIFRASNQ